MQVTIEYAAQVKRAAGVASESLNLDEPSTVQDIVSQVSQSRGDEFRNLLLTADGELHPSILLFADDQQLRWETPHEARDGMVISLLSPISGG